MTWNEYRKAVDALPLSPDFPTQTEVLLHQRAQETAEKEYMIMKKRTIGKIAAIAAVIALLTVSAYAAARRLGPGEVAELAGEPVLAQAFPNMEDAVYGEGVETGEYRVTLTGLVSGAGLTGWSQDIDQEHTYAVVALERLDGTPLDRQTFPFTDYTLTPLVAGVTPWSVNNWSLDASARGVERDGIYYYLLDVANLEIFADHTVYLAFYEGGAPSREIFVMNEDGEISFQESFAGPHALFVLPLDAGKADPAAVEAFMDGSGFDRDWFTGTSSVPEAAPSEAPAAKPEDSALLTGNR